MGEPGSVESMVIEGGSRAMAEVDTASIVAIAVNARVECFVCENMRFTMFIVDFPYECIVDIYMELGSALKVLTGFTIF